MVINAKTRAEIQNANSQLKARARFQTPMLGLSFPPHAVFATLGQLPGAYEVTPQTAMEQSSQIAGGTQVL